jgi:hypothetical protein
MHRLYVIAALSFFSCGQDLMPDEEVVALLGNKKLLIEDIKDQLPKPGTLPEADSIALVQTLARNWAKNELMVQAAEFNLKADLRDFEDLVLQYRNDLLKHAYIERYVSENLDTNVSEKEIAGYYAENQSNFELKESIVRAKYTAVPLEAQKMKEAKHWFKTPRQENKYLDWIEVFATKQSAYTDSSWVPLDEFLNDIPLESSNPYSYLKRTQRFTCEDTVMVYFVSVNDIRIKNSYSPLEYVRENIRKMILNKRRLALIEAIGENIIANAIEKGDLLIP